MYNFRTSQGALFFKCFIFSKSSTVFHMHVQIWQLLMCSILQMFHCFKVDYSHSCMYKFGNSSFAFFNIVFDLDSNRQSSKCVHMLLQTLGHERIALVLFAWFCLDQIINTISHNSKMANFTPITILLNTERVGHVFPTLRLYSR